MARLKRILARVLARAARSLSLKLIRDDIYAPVPELPATQAGWDLRSSMAGVEWDLERQLAFVRGELGPWLGELEGFDLANGFYTHGDAELLHAILRWARPTRMIDERAVVPPARAVGLARALPRRRDLGHKRRVALWAARPEHVFDERELHALKVPMQARWGRIWPLADLEVYRLRLVDPEDRRARRSRYQELDPDESYQPGIGYAYLTDERGLHLQPVPRVPALRSWRAASSAARATARGMRSPV